VGEVAASRVSFGVASYSWLIVAGWEAYENVKIKVTYQSTQIENDTSEAFFD